MIVAIAVAAVVIAVCLRAWRNLPSREFPADGRHAPRPIHNNRSKR